MWSPYRYAARLIGHHFPRGKTAADRGRAGFCRQAGQRTAQASERNNTARSAGFAPSSLVASNAGRSKFQARCPVLCVAVEQYVNDATEKDGVPDEAAQKRLLDLAEGVFSDWQAIMIAAMRREGVTAARGPAACGTRYRSRWKARSRCAGPRAASSRSKMSGRSWSWCFRAHCRSNAAVHAIAASACRISVA